MSRTVNTKFFFKSHDNTQFTLGRLSRPHVSLSRKQRSAHLHTEWYNHEGIRWFNITVGSPTVHEWWAFSLSVFITMPKVKP